MNKFITTALAALTVTAATAAAPRPGQDYKPFRFMPKANAELTRTVQSGNRFDAGIKSATKGVPVNAAAAEDFIIRNLPEADNTNFLNAPDGSTWYYTMDYNKEQVDMGAYTATVIKGYTVNVYDGAFNLLGTVTDAITLKENETRVADVQVGPQVTKKFFNYDNAYEIMVNITCNTTEFVNNTYTKVYSLGNNTALLEIPGYYISAINTATDSFSERFWITFLTEEETETPEVNGVLNTVDYVLNTYKSASYSGLGDPLLTYRIPSITAAGENYIPMVATVSEGRPFFGFNRMKYCWFEDPYDFENENPTPNNELIVDVYAAPSSFASTIEKYSTTTLPSAATADNQLFYYLGNFSYNDDLSMGTYTTDGTPGLIISTGHYRPGNDDSTYDFTVYSGAAKGTEAAATKLFDLATGVDVGLFLSDVKGFDPQVMFVHQAMDTYVFDFVNILTGEVEHTLPYMLADNIYTTTMTDRVAWGSSYLYVSPQTRGASNEAGDVLTSVAYINPDGTVNHIDNINLGKDVDYAEVYTGVDAFNPFIFNLDTKQEYMMLVKRRNTPGAVGNHEELVIAQANTDTFEPILQLGPDAELGNIVSVFLANTDSDDKSLVVIYSTGDYAYTTRAYQLPLESYTEGDGSVENPYQITSAGGLAQIKANPSAHYIVACDIDAQGTTINSDAFEFTGSIDGQNHTIRNLNIEGHALIPTLKGEGEASESSLAGTVKNLTFVKPTFTATSDKQGILVGTASYANISNVHIRKAKISTTGEDIAVAGLVGNASLYSKISECSVNAEIEAGEGEAAGIVLELRTSSTVSACAFSGSIHGGSTLGGIVSDLNMNSGTVSDCHVNADITGFNTIGGIAGSSMRTLITRCHVQGSLTATKAPNWGGGPKTGGIVGSLQEFNSTGYDDQGNEITITPTPAITNCYVNLSSLTFEGEERAEEWTGQNATMHRIVGYSTINAEPPYEDYDDEWNPIYLDPYPADPGLANNYATAMLSAVDESEEMDALDSTEGLSVNPFNLTQEFFEAMGFNYGYDAENPWNMTGDAAAPSLYFEKTTLTLIVTPENGEVKVGDEITLVLSAEDEEITEEMVENFSYDCTDWDEAYLSYVDMALVDGTIHFTFRGVAPGKVDFTFNLSGATATASVTVKEASAIGEVSADSSAITYANGIATAHGCLLKVFNTQGALVLTGADTADLRTLAAGIYVITATDAEGNTSTLKARN